VAEHARELRDPDLAVEQVQVGAADAAGKHAQQQLAGPASGTGRSTMRIGPPTCSEHHRPHACMITPVSGADEAPAGRT
jgi:hypothetical protein